MLSAYHRRLTHEDPAVQREAARAWAVALLRASPVRSENRRRDHV